MRGFSLSERHRKFAKEVGGIVLGVLIALALGEVATAIRWRFEAAEAKSAMLSDFEQDAGVMHERRLARACIQRRLDDVDALLRQARRSGRLPQVSAIGRPPTRPLVTAAWDMGVSSGVLPHLSQVDANGFSTNFGVVKDMAAILERQRSLWNRLSAMENAAGPVTQDFLSELTFTTAELRTEGDYVDMVAGQVVDSGKAIGKLDYWLILDREHGTAAEVVVQLHAKPICLPLLVDGKPYSG